MIVTPAPGVGPHSPTSRTPHPLAVRTRVYDPRSPLPGPAPSPLRAGVGADHTPQLRATPSPQRPSGGLRFPAWTQTPGRVVGGRVPVRTGLVRIPPPPPRVVPCPRWAQLEAGVGYGSQAGPDSSPLPRRRFPQRPPDPAPGTPCPGSRGRCRRQHGEGRPAPRLGHSEDRNWERVSGASWAGARRAGGHTDLFPAASEGVHRPMPPGWPEPPLSDIVLSPKWGGPHLHPGMPGRASRGVGKGPSASVSSSATWGSGGLQQAVGGVPTPASSSSQLLGTPPPPRCPPRPAVGEGSPPSHMETSQPA